MHFIISKKIDVAGAVITFSASAAETLQIGLALSITGPASSLGDPEKKVIELYADKANNYPPFTWSKAGTVIGFYSTEALH